MKKFIPGRRIPPKVLINIGTLMDYPTGPIVTGKMGEKIINGGYSKLTGIIGAGNNFKSTILHHMSLAAMNVVAATHETNIATYDTEMNISLDRLESMAKHYPYLAKDGPVIETEDAIWNVTDKSMISGNEWVKELVEYGKSKEKDKEGIVEFTAFRDPYTGQVLKEPIPVAVEIDSVTEMTPDSTGKILDGDLDDPSSNTMFMKNNLFKTKVFTLLPSLTNKANIYIGMSAHIGEKIIMASGPAMLNRPKKKTQFLPADIEIKGATGKFLVLTQNAWHANTATVLKNQTTKLPEYPKKGVDSTGTDLNIVRLTQLRGKAGQSGYTLEIIVSQEDGVLPTLTEFHYIKSNKRYGMEGNDRTYNICFRPDVNLQRTTVREKIDTDKLLCRAIGICADMKQIGMFHSQLAINGYLVEPKELYEGLKSKGYDWDMLLKARPWYAIDQYNKTIPPFLSTVDLLYMLKDNITPYWIDSKTKKQKKEYDEWFQ